MITRTLARILEFSRLRFLLGTAIRWSGVLSLNYHRIGECAETSLDSGLWSASSAELDEQLRFVNRHCDVIRPDDLARVVRRGKGRHVLITFDDGYRDNYEVAFPILSSHGIRAIFFISTGFVDYPRLAWWDQIAWMVRSSKKTSIGGLPWLKEPVFFEEPHRERAVRTLLRKYKSIPDELAPSYLDFLAEVTGSGQSYTGDISKMWMTWDMLREMKAAGMEIGGHTVNHPVLSRMSRDRQLQEILSCRERLAEEVGTEMRYFSYPVGGLHAFNDDTRSVLKECGVEFAFSYYGGYCKFSGWDAYDIRRFAVERYLGAEVFRSVVTFPQVFGRPDIPKSYPE